jgi:hypothetical protein
MNGDRPRMGRRDTSILAFRFLSSLQAREQSPGTSVSLPACMHADLSWDTASRANMLLSVPCWHHRFVLSHARTSFAPRMPFLIGPPFLSTCLSLKEEILSNGQTSCDQTGMEVIKDVLIALQRQHHRPRWQNKALPLSMCAIPRRKD